MNTEMNCEMCEGYFQAGKDFCKKCNFDLNSLNKIETFWEMMEERIAKGELCGDCHNDTDECSCNDEVKCESCDIKVKHKDAHWGEEIGAYGAHCEECYQISQETIELVEPCFVCNYPCLTKSAINGMCEGCERYHRCAKGDCLCGACEKKMDCRPCIEGCGNWILTTNKEITQCQMCQENDE